MIEKLHLNEKWISYPKPNHSAKYRLFCFPYAGGGALVYRNWPNFFPENFEVCFVHLPGREKRLNEKPFRDVFSLVEALIPGLLPYLDKPFIFFGYSMGALIGYETASILQKKFNVRPELLVVSAHNAPGVCVNEEKVHTLDDERFIQKLREMKGTDEALLQNKEIMDLLLPILRADFAISENYSSKENYSLNCPIMAIGGTEDPDVPEKNLSLWQNYTNSLFNLRMLQGGHFFIHRNEKMLTELIVKEVKQNSKFNLKK